MKNVRFELQVYCTVGWDDNEDTAILEVGTFTDIIDTVNVLKNYEKARSNLDRDSKVTEAYKEIKEELKSESGEEIIFVGEVIGINCLYEDDKGVRAGMTISDDSGVSGWAKVNSEKHNSKYKKQLSEAKKLAANIMRL